LESVSDKSWEPAEGEALIAISGVDLPETISKGGGEVWIDLVNATKLGGTRKLLFSFEQ